MKPQKYSACILVLLSALALCATGASGGTVTVLQTFVYPYLPNATATLPQKVSDQGDLVGTVMDVNNQALGFIYKFRLGRFSAPILEPNDTGHITQGRGINNLRRVCGEYLNASDGTFHGYKLFHPDFAEFDVVGATDTIPLGINNAGDLAGAVTLTDGTKPGFISVRKRVTTFAVPDAVATYAYQLNTANQIIGYYTDASGVDHGFTRDSDGTLTYPIDVAGAAGTMLLGNNDSNWGVGRYTDTFGVTHGLYYIDPGTIQTYDYPGATFTSLNGVNIQGTLCGYYIDENGLAHGFVAKLNPGGSSQPNNNLPVAPSKLARLLSEMARSGQPAL